MVSAWLIYPIARPFQKLKYQPSAKSVKFYGMGGQNHYTQLPSSPLGENTKEIKLYSSQEGRLLVPLVSEFFGIKIYMYWDDHLPGHFHAEYGNLKALVSIREGVVIRGLLPVKQLKLVLAWCEIHKEELIKNWESAKAHGSISKIEPLR
jgi:Domain of unknown function (DUF4160)